MGLVVGLGNGAGAPAAARPWPWGKDRQPPPVLLVGDMGMQSPPLAGNYSSHDTILAVL